MNCGEKCMCFWCSLYGVILCGYFVVHRVLSHCIKNLNEESDRISTRI